MKINQKVWLLLSFIFYVGVFYVIQYASIAGQIFPFAFGLLFALIWANQKVWIVCPAYLLAAVAYSCTFEYIISVLVCCLLAALPYYIHVLLKKNMHRWEILIYAAVSQVATVVFQILGGFSPVLAVLQVMIGVLFQFAAMLIFEPLIMRGFAYKLTSLELICAGALLLAISDGLSAFTLFGFSFFKLFAVFVLLFVSYTEKSPYACLVGGVMGLGSLLGSNNPVFIAPILLWALSITAFRSRIRWFPFLAVIACELVCGYYFQLYYSYTWLQILPVVLGSIIYVCIPQKCYDQLAVLLSSGSDRLAMKNVVNRNREMLHRRLSNLAEVFYEMDDVFKKLIKKEMSPDEVKDMLFEEIRDANCKNCPEYKHCHRTFSDDTKKMFEELIQIAMERGKITLLDFPSYLTSRCHQVNALISEINTLTQQYKNYASLVGNVDISKRLISDQLGGISNIMKSLANEVDTMVSFDTVRENKIIDELAYHNIICSDAVVYEKDARTIQTSLIVRSEDVDRPAIIQAVSKICGSKMTAVDMYPTSRTGLVTLNLKTAPRYDCIFGVASQNKSGSSISGDCHSVVRLDGDKFMFALCDGMGSGDKAGEKSETAISLIENFYKAGFDNEIILSSVNKLLNLEKDEIFSTLDICVIDLRSGLADFVKMGSPSSYLCNQENVQIIEGGALPIGVIQDAKAMTKKLVITEKEFIVLSSDGVADSFGSDSEFRDYLLSLRSANPQEIADQVLERALANNNGYAVDDMTCLVVKVFQP